MSYPMGICLEDHISGERHVSQTTSDDEYYSRKQVLAVLVIRVVSRTRGMSKDMSWGLCVRVPHSGTLCIGLVLHASACLSSGTLRQSGFGCCVMGCRSRSARKNAG